MKCDGEESQYDTIESVRLPDLFMIRSRLQRLQKLLSRTSVHSLLVSNLMNIRYLTGMQVSAGLLWVTNKGAVLFVDARYSEMASKRAETDITIAAPQELSTRLAASTSIGFESDDVTVERLGAWKKKLKNKRLVQTKGLIEGLRRQKDPEELRAIKHACRITKHVLSRVPTLLRLGITERELSHALYCDCVKQGAMCMAFETIVAFGENTSRPHHHPTNRILKKGDLVQVDMGASVEGYCSDYSRVFFTDEALPAQKKAYRALKEAKKSAEKLLRPGVLTTTLDREARRVLKLHGFEKEFTHSLGHGLGLDIHEGVTLSERARPMKLLRNEVITIEPGLYFEGEWGMRIEDTIVVTSKTK